MKALKISQKRMAEMWCELNCWITPKEFKRRKRKISDAEIGGAMAMIELLTTPDQRGAAWTKPQGVRKAAKK
jgi:hypothetical protein